MVTHEGQSRIARSCAECGGEIPLGHECYVGVAPKPNRVRNAGIPEGSACLLCVDELAQGRDPRAAKGAVA